MHVCFAVYENRSSHYVAQKNMFASVVCVTHYEALSASETYRAQRKTSYPPILMLHLLAVMTEIMNPSVRKFESAGSGNFWVCCVLFVWTEMYFSHRQSNTVWVVVFGVNIMYIGEAWCETECGNLASTARPRFGSEPLWLRHKVLYVLHRLLAANITAWRDVTEISLLFPACRSEVLLAVSSNVSQRTPFDVLMFVCLCACHLKQ